VPHYTKGLRGESSTLAPASPHGGSTPSRRPLVRNASSYVQISLCSPLYLRFQLIKFARERPHGMSGILHKGRGKGDGGRESNEAIDIEL
jgi:hypothetical protein